MSNEEESTEEETEEDAQVKTPTENQQTYSSQEQVSLEQKLLLKRQREQAELLANKRRVTQEREALEKERLEIERERIRLERAELERLRNFNANPPLYQEQVEPPQSRDIGFWILLFIITTVLCVVMYFAWEYKKVLDYEKEQEYLAERLEKISYYTKIFGVEVPVPPYEETDIEKVENIVAEKVEKKLKVEKLYEAKKLPKKTIQIGCTPSQSRRDRHSYSHESYAPCSVFSEPKTVTLSNNCHMMRSEVTQALYKHVMITNPSKHQGDRLPVENVDYEDIARFANKLSELEGRSACFNLSKYKEKTFVGWTNQECTGWRLPLNAEWEYAARGGEDYRFSGGNDLFDVAWYRGNSKEKTHEVCQKKTNGYGLCDMTGNVAEAVLKKPLSTKLRTKGSWYGMGISYEEEAALEVSHTYQFYKGRATGFRLIRCSF